MIKNNDTQKVLGCLLGAMFTVVTLLGIWVYAFSLGLIFNIPELELVGDGIIFIVFPIVYKEYIKIGLNFGRW